MVKVSGIEKKEKYSRRKRKKRKVTVVSLIIIFHYKGINQNKDKCNNTVQDKKNEQPHLSILLFLLLFYNKIYMLKFRNG